MHRVTAPCIELRRQAAFLPIFDQRERAVAMPALITHCATAAMKALACRAAIGVNTPWSAPDHD